MSQGSVRRWWRYGGKSEIELNLGASGHSWSKTGVEAQHLTVKSMCVRARARARACVCVCVCVCVCLCVSV